MSQSDELYLIPGRQVCLVKESRLIFLIVIVLIIYPKAIIKSNPGGLVTHL
jgi:hypothetical protein